MTNSLEILLTAWLDDETAAAVVDITQSLAITHPEVLAVILFGSVARRHARPLDDPQPSDVDLLVLLDPQVFDPATGRLASAHALALTHTIGEADYRHRSAPREVKTLLMDRALARWDPQFLDNVLRDGFVVWARGPLPAPFTALKTLTSRHGLASSFPPPVSPTASTA